MHDIREKKIVEKKTSSNIQTHCNRVNKEKNTSRKRTKKKNGVQESATRIGSKGLFLIPDDLQRDIVVRIRVGAGRGPADAVIDERLANVDRNLFLLAAFQSPSYFSIPLSRYRVRPGEQPRRGSRQRERVTFVDRPPGANEAVSALPFASATEEEGAGGGPQGRRTPGYISL